MKLSAKFYWNDYVNNYAIDYYNDLTEEEKIYLSNKLKINISSVEHLFYKDYNDWSSQIGGMTFDLKMLAWYPVIKEHLDNEFNKFMRKKKLEKIENGS